MQSGLLGALRRATVSGFSADFYGHDQRKDSDKIIKHIDYQSIYTFDQYYKMSKMDGAYGNHLRQNNLKGNLFYEAR